MVISSRLIEARQIGGEHDGKNCDGRRERPGKSCDGPL